jgi:hypothetical protein
VAVPGDGVAVGALVVTNSVGDGVVARVGAVAIADGAALHETSASNDTNMSLVIDRG